MFKQKVTLPIPAEKAGFVISKIRYIKEKSGAKVNIYNNNVPNKQPSAVIFGNEDQRTAAMTLIKETLDRAFFIPTIGFTLLELDNLAVNANKAKFQFVKFEENAANVNVRSSDTKDRDNYFVQLMKETKDSSDEQKLTEVDELADLLGQNLDISLPSTGFTTSEKLEQCLNKIYPQLSVADPTDIERKEIRLNLFFGRELFSNVGKKIFSIKEWTKFKRERGNNRTVFRQCAPIILERMDILEKNFGFKEDKGKELTLEDKGSISIYFEQDSRRRKFKLHWKEGSWKITKYIRDINRLAILDTVSGTEAPDFRFLLKTSHELTIASKITEIVNEIQSKGLDLRDGMWFRVKDFDGKLDNVEIRQIISKRRFFNDRFQISFVTIKQESNDQISVDQTASLKNRSWRSVENIDQNLSLHYDEQEIRNTIRETVQFAREIVKVLS